MENNKKQAADVLLYLYTNQLLLVYASQHILYEKYNNLLC